MHLRRVFRHKAFALPASFRGLSSSLGSGLSGTFFQSGRCPKAVWKDLDFSLKYLLPSQSALAQAARREEVTCSMRVRGQL